MNNEWRRSDDGDVNESKNFKPKKVVGKRFFPREGNQQNWRDRNLEAQNGRDVESQPNNCVDDFASSWGITNETYSKPKPKARRQRNANDTHLTIDVPSDKVGKIIGRGGSKIRELQDETQTEIQILKDDEADNGMKQITLIGSEDDVQKVHKLIENLIIDKARYESTPSQSNTFEEDNDNHQEIDWLQLAKNCEEEAAAFWNTLPDINKNFYVEDPTIAKMSSQQVQKIRESNNNTTVGYVFDEKTHLNKIPNPVTNFEQCFKPYPEILEGIRKMGFEKPSPIQAQAWPVLMSGQDLIGIAQTGTGKTLAFLLPALIHIEGQVTPRSERKGPTVLILAPTRELAQQIEKEVKKYNYKDIKAVCLYGGGSRKDQINICNRGVEIVIATPGRLSDLTVAGHIDMKSVSYLVLDEADRMLDLGFEPQIRKILLDIRPNRQTVMTSATWPPGVRRLAQSYTQDPIQVCVGTLDLAAVHSVTQTIIHLEDNDDVKYNELMNFINSMEEDWKVIVFCGKKSRVDHLSSELALQGIACATIHGDLEQCDREQSLADISAGRLQILIATDVASRGIDIADITHVLNFDFPRNVEEYVHRVGRTGRAGRTGESITFLTRSDWSNAKELISILEEANQSVPQELHDMSRRFEAFQERRALEKAALRNYGRNDGGGGYRGRRGGGGGSRNRW
ncbi:probable ATP-dependent RNA helicase DDX43 [Chrysoperla carnea]|uniref:probable ATP-dependent RNA helicase DDX43 n=1 Tax=Chrysoperla carnea TaxID=189513 RepID=UPI001D07FB57|nr:probable ATP-dependent RNA helicase DDX43 [Chrysoperla carnea]